MLGHPPGPMTTAQVRPCLPTLEATGTVAKEKDKLRERCQDPQVRRLQRGGPTLSDTHTGASPGGNLHLDQEEPKASLSLIQLVGSLSGHWVDKG